MGFEMCTVNGIYFVWAADGVEDDNMSGMRASAWQWSAIVNEIRPRGSFRIAVPVRQVDSMEDKLSTKSLNAFWGRRSDWDGTRRARTKAGALLTLKTNPNLAPATKYVFGRYRLDFSMELIILYLKLRLQESPHLIGSHRLSIPPHQLPSSIRYTARQQLPN